MTRPTRIWGSLCSDSVLMLGFSLSDWRLPLMLSLVEHADKISGYSGFAGDRNPANIVVQISPDELSATIPPTGFTALHQKFFAMEQPLDEFAEQFMERFRHQ